MTAQANIGTTSEQSGGRTKTSSLTGNLGVGSIVFMVIAAAAPLTVIGGQAPLGMGLGNGVGFPAMFAASAIILLLFSVGLGVMSANVPKAGAFFTYIGYGLGRPMGLAAAYLALLTYTTIQVAIYGYLAWQLETLVAGMGGPSLPWWLYALAMIAVVGFLGYRDIDLSSKVLGVLLVGEIGVVLVLNALVVFRGGAAGLSLAPFAPSNVVSGSPGIGLIFALVGFIGFEATAIFRDEAKDPAKTIPRATYLAVIIIGVFYTVSSWALVMAWGPKNAVAASQEHSGDLILVTAQNYMGTIGRDIVNLLLLTSLFACVLSFHNVLTRYQHSMASTGLLPSFFGRVHPDHNSPHASSLAQTATAAALIVLFAVLHLDPVAQVLTWFSAVSTLAIAVLMAFTCLAVIVYFARTRLDTRWWHTKVAPALGLIGLTIAVLMIAANFTLLLGGSTLEAVGFLLGMLAFPVYGFAQAIYLRKTKPEVYEKITESVEV